MGARRPASEALAPEPITCHAGMASAPAVATSPMIPSTRRERRSTDGRFAPARAAIVTVPAAAAVGTSADHSGQSSTWTMLTDTRARRTT